MPIKGTKWFTIILMKSTLKTFQDAPVLDGNSLKGVNVDVVKAETFQEDIFAIVENHNAISQIVENHNANVQNFAGHVALGDY